jgi:hypothetical protein
VIGDFCLLVMVGKVFWFVALVLIYALYGRPLWDFTFFLLLLTLWDELFLWGDACSGNSGNLFVFAVWEGWRS